MSRHDWSEIREGVERLATEPHSHEIFGSVVHRWVLEPPMPPEEVADLEDQLWIELPEEYRSFLLEAGRGPAFNPKDELPQPKPSDFTTPQEYQAADDEYWDTYSLLIEDPRYRTGLVYLCDLGCGLREVLVVTGPERGQMWTDRIVHRSLTQHAPRL